MSRVAFKQCDLDRATRVASRAPRPYRVRVERETGDILLEPVDGALDRRRAANASDEALDAEIEALLNEDRD